MDDVLTRTGGRAYTPAYAAPEQFSGDEVTTATDVYGLGALLYELLVGTRPYDLADATAADVERRKALPPRPPSAAASPDRARALRGDLDTICLKALDPDPTRRYASAAALSDDLCRHLDGLPVQARPATVRYRASRFIRRHRTSVVAVSLVALALIRCLTALWQARVAQNERDHARRAAAEAEAQTERAEAVAGFLEQILRAPNTRWYNDAVATGPATPIRAVLDEAAARVDRDFADRPDLLADLHHILGDTYLSLGLAAEARRHHRRTLVLRESLYTAPDPRIAEALYYVSSTLGRADIREQIRLMERAVAMQRVRNEGNNFPFMANDLGGLYNELGRSAEADALFAEATAFVEDHFVPGSDGGRYRDRILIILNQRWSTALLGLGRLDDADRQLAASDSVLARLPRLAVHHEAWQSQMCALGALRLSQGSLDEAEADLLACYGAGPPGAAASPFPSTKATALANVRPFQDSGALALETLYDDAGRPAEAAPYRAQAAQVRAKTDSIRVAFRSAELP